MAMTPEDKQLLHIIAQSIEHKYLRVETIRHLAGTEENYRLIIREIDRIKAQLIRARAFNTPATLTVIEWFATLDRYDWKCAYCQLKPFKAMSHIFPQQEAGTTAENCVPACHSCLPKPNKKIMLN
jgi:hypothetical protein